MSLPPCLLTHTKVAHTCFLFFICILARSYEWFSPLQLEETGAMRASFVLGFTLHIVAGLVHGDRDAGYYQPRMPAGAFL